MEHDDLTEQVRKNQQVFGCMHKYLSNLYVDTTYCPGDSFHDVWHCWHILLTRLQGVVESQTTRQGYKTNCELYEKLEDIVSINPYPPIAIAVFFSV